MMTSVRKIFLILGIIAIKVEKQGQSSTPADILVDNLIPNLIHLAEL